MSHKNFFQVLSPFRVVTVIILIIGATACKSTDSVQNGTSETGVKTSDMEALYWDRIESARMNFTDADVAFMTGMIGHHAQALIMSRLAPENGASPEIQRLAARIINAQKDEIVTMQEWLRLRGQPVPEIHIDGLNLMIHGLDHHHSDDHAHMPGMLTQEQLQDLADAQGEDFDRLFLTYMIEHHEGAVTMVTDLFGTDGAAQENEAFRLASDIQVDQITEIERMKLMLNRYSGSETESKHSTHQSHK